MPITYAAMTPRLPQSGELPILFILNPLLGWHLVGGVPRHWPRHALTAEMSLRAREVLLGGTRNRRSRLRHVDAVVSPRSAVSACSRDTAVCSQKADEALKSADCSCGSLVRQKR